MNGIIRTEPKRLAILIGAPGSGDDRLLGVPNDLVNVEQYLLSPRGGAWQSGEMISMFDPLRDQVLEIIQLAEADYVFIYFSGHGYMLNGLHNMLCIRGGDLEDFLLFNQQTLRQLLICDCCRVFYHTISGFPEELEQYQYADGYLEAREIFNRYIIASKPGRMIVHATSRDEAASDDRYGRGGEFTLALLHSLYSCQSYYGTYAITIQSAFVKTVKRLRDSQEEQVPEITHEEGELTVPLGIASSRFIRKQAVLDQRNERLREMKRMQDQRNAQNVLVGTVLAGLILWGLSE